MKYPVLRDAAVADTVRAAPFNERGVGIHALPEVLTRAALMRSDITSGRPGTPLLLTLRLQAAANRFAPLANAAVHVWHCDRDGVLPQAEGNVLQGVQITDALGEVTFQTIYPGWQIGQGTGIQCRIFINGDDNQLQVAACRIELPRDMSDAVHRTAAYMPRGPGLGASDVGRLGASLRRIFGGVTARVHARVVGNPAGILAAEATVSVALPG